MDDGGDKMLRFRATRNKRRFEIGFARQDRLDPVRFRLGTNLPGDAIACVNFPERSVPRLIDLDGSRRLA